MPCPSINLIQTFVKECILCWSFQFLLLGTCTPDAIDSGSSRIGTLVVRCCAQDAITSYLDRLRLQIRKEGRPKRATCCKQNYGSFWKGTHWHHWFWMCLACVETCMLEVCIVSTLTYCTCFSLYFWILLAGASKAYCSLWYFRQANKDLLDAFLAKKARSPVTSQDMFEKWSKLWCKNPKVWELPSLKLT